MPVSVLVLLIHLANSLCKGWTSLLFQQLDTPCLHPGWILSEQMLFSYKPRRRDRAQNTDMANCWGGRVAAGTLIHSGGTLAWCSPSPVGEYEHCPYTLWQAQSLVVTQKSQQLMSLENQDVEDYRHFYPNCPNSEQLRCPLK